jgi:glucan endo-1,3-beta-D-glucosidase
LTCTDHVSYPYYEKDKGNSYANLTNVWDYISSQVNSAAAVYSKPVWVTETGWPTSGPDFGEAKASVDNAKGYWDTIGCGKLFGRTNTWWYNIRDSNPANKEKFAITKDLSTTPLFDLTCPSGSGAPATINAGPVTNAAELVQIRFGKLVAVCVGVAMMFV